MRLSSIAHLYRVRLKVRLVLVQELLAVLGLSVGVALLFASQVASASLNGSVQQLASELVGNMQFQLQSRDPRGFDESLLGQVRQLPGVSAALPLLEGPPSAIGPTGRQAIELIGADPRLTLRRQPAVEAFPLRPARSFACARAAGSGCRKDRGAAAAADRVADRREQRHRTGRHVARHDRDRWARA